MPVEIAEARGEPEVASAAPVAVSIVAIIVESVVPIVAITVVIAGVIAVAIVIGGAVLPVLAPFVVRLRARGGESRTDRDRRHEHTCENVIACHSPSLLKESMCPGLVHRIRQCLD